MRPVERVTVQCVACGADIIKRVTDAARNKTGRHFCSVECRGLIGSRQRSRNERPCRQCGTVFYPIGDATMFCSRACANKAQIISPERECENCGATFRAVKGKRERHCSRPCYVATSYKRPLDRTHNGKPAVLDNSGYVRIYEPGHPSATKSGWVFEHRWVVEQALGRTLAWEEHVHHLNHVRDDNRPENLQLLSNTEHGLITGKENGEALKAAVEARQLLARYEALYGPLPVA